jgi:hypothetical protein
VTVDHANTAAIVILLVGVSTDPFEACRAEYMRQANGLRLMDD